LLFCHHGIPSNLKSSLHESLAAEVMAGRTGSRITGFSLRSVRCEPGSFPNARRDRRSSPPPTTGVALHPAMNRAPRIKRVFDIERYRRCRTLSNRQDSEHQSSAVCTRRTLKQPKPDTSPHLG
jgi:hypothetical protein